MTGRPATVVVTGAGGGLGSALVAHHVAHGATVVATDREVGVDVLGPGTVHWVAADLTDQADLDRIVATATQVAGQTGIDQLVHCAGVTHRSPASTTDLAVLDLVMAVNWRAPVVLTRRTLPLVVRARGTVVVLGSMAGWMPVLGRSGYGASKAAVTQFMEAWRPELEDAGVGLLMVHPSFLDSVMADAAGDTRPRSQVGTPMPVDELVQRIEFAVQHRTPWLFPDRFAHLSSLLWRVAPATYHTLMRRRFEAEL